MHNRLRIALIASMSIILFGCATSLPPEGREKAVGEKTAFPEPGTGSEVSPPESGRKEIFKEIIAAEDKATAEAERRFPADIEKQIDFEGELIKKYKAELAEKHGLTFDQLKSIGVEGITNNWSMPSRDSGREVAKKPRAEVKRPITSGQRDRDRYLRRLREMGVDESLVLKVTRGLDDNEAKITVSNSWHFFPYQVRLEAAQNLWKIWASICSPSDPDKARIELVSINGNKVGGSRWLAGSLIYVQKD